MVKKQILILRKVVLAQFILKITSSVIFNKVFLWLGT